jgi:hypothetical protein
MTAVSRGTGTGEQQDPPADRCGEGGGVEEPTDEETMEAISKDGPGKGFEPREAAPIPAEGTAVHPEEAFGNGAGVIWTDARSGARETVVSDSSKPSSAVRREYVALPGWILGQHAKDQDPNLSGHGLSASHLFARAISNTAETQPDANQPPFSVKQDERPLPRQSEDEILRGLNTLTPNQSKCRKGFPQSSRFSRFMTQYTRLLSELIPILSSNSIHACTARILPLYSWRLWRTVMNAIAISNNDMVYLHWDFKGKITDCLGFSVIRHDAKMDRCQPILAMVGFPADKQTSKEYRDTNVWPVQKHSWKDLFAERGGTYWYEIVPMMGKPGELKPDFKRAMRTNTVAMDSKRGNCSVFFNRGIISTQAIARKLPKRKGIPDTSKLKQWIREPGNPIRARLAGDLETGVLTLLERSKNEGGQCYCALYELSDKKLIDNLKSLKKNIHIVLSNAGEDTAVGIKDGDSTNKDARYDLHQCKLDVTDRILKKGYIGHNKFVVYVKDNVAKAVLCGSTNWTPNGLCAQSNNAILIESPAVAKEYFEYWKLLKEDTTGAKGDSTELQSKKFRETNRKEKKRHELSDERGRARGDARVWFSPNTPQKSVPGRKNKDGSARKPPPTPRDIAEVFELIENAKQGALFLAFIPGNPSIVSKLREVYDLRKKNNILFYLRGAATSPDPASVFRVDLYHRSGQRLCLICGRHFRDLRQMGSGDLQDRPGGYPRQASRHRSVHR